jgi:hypothetical protein
VASRLLLSAVRPWSDSTAYRIPPHGYSQQYKPLDAVTTNVSDRSLDEFATPSPPTDEVDEDGDGADDSSTTSDPDTDPTPDATEAATPTMRWSSTPVACDACGAAVSCRWRATGGSSTADAEGFVCADCKEW